MTKHHHRKKIEPVGRYDGGYDARVPANGLARPVPSPNLHTTTGVVPDPMEPGARVHATINRRVDILELERSHHRITEAAYRTGRVAQAVFERASGARSPSYIPGERVDTTLARDLHAVLALDDARAIVNHERWIISVLGHLDARIVRAVLKDGRSFAQVAQARGQSGRDATGYYARRFRDALEQLAHAQVARGKDQAPIRGERNAPVEGEEYDRSGILVAQGERGYRVAGDAERLAHLHDE